MSPKLCRFMQAGTFCACLLFLAGCGGEPYVYEPDNELKPGPGIFSGEDGEFTLIGSPPEEKSEEEPGKKAEDPASEIAQ